MLVFKPLRTLLQREFGRLARFPVRIWSFIFSPFLLAVAVSSGFGSGLVIPGLESQDLSHYFFPSLVVLSVVLAAMQAPVSILEDRRDGFLQAVLVAPISYSSLVFAKIIAGTGMGLAHAFVLTAFAPLIGIPLTLPSLSVILAIIIVVGGGFAALGFAIAWLSDSAASFHSLVGMLILPAWLIGGGIAPLPASSWLSTTSAFNPIAFSIATLRSAYQPIDEKAAIAILTSADAIACLVFFLSMLLLCYVLLKARIRTSL